MTGVHPYFVLFGKGLEDRWILAAVKLLWGKVRFPIYASGYIGHHSRPAGKSPESDGAGHPTVNHYVAPQRCL